MKMTTYKKSTQMPARVTVLGIDPGTTRMGYGVVCLASSTLTYGACGIVSSAPRLSDGLRLQDLYKKLSALIAEHRPDVIALEELFFAKNQKTIIPVASARGVALLVAAQHGKETHLFTPLQVKQAVTGYGQADKRQVQKMMCQLLKLESIPRPDDAADALAVAVCCAHSLPMLRALKNA
jgi:crossover junction endodeoxyribonuclease RuvC